MSHADLLHLLAEVDLSKVTPGQVAIGIAIVGAIGTALGAWITTRGASATTDKNELGKFRVEQRGEIGELKSELEELQEWKAQQQEAQAKRDGLAAYQMRTIQRFVRKVKALLERLQSGDEYKELISDADEILTFPCEPPPAFTPNTAHLPNPPP